MHFQVGYLNGAISFVLQSFFLKIICPKHHLSYRAGKTSFVLHLHFICPKPHLSYIHLSFTSFFLHLICPTLHLICLKPLLSYTSFVLHLICPTNQSSYSSFFLYFNCHTCITITLAPDPIRVQSMCLLSILNQ